MFVASWFMWLQVSEEANYEESIPLNEAGISRFLSRAKTMEELQQVLDENSIKVLHRSLARLCLGQCQKHVKKTCKTSAIRFGVRFWEILRLLPVHTSTKQHRAGMQVKILASTSFDSSTFLKFLKGLGWKKHIWFYSKTTYRDISKRNAANIVRSYLWSWLPWLLVSSPASHDFGLSAFEYAVGRCVVDAFFP